MAGALGYSIVGRRSDSIMQVTDCRGPDLAMYSASWCKRKFGWFVCANGALSKLGFIVRSSLQLTLHPNTSFSSRRLLGGSCVDASWVISSVSNYNYNSTMKGLVTPLATTHEPPSAT